MGIKQSMWQYLDNDFLKLKYWWADTWKQFQFWVRSGFLCHLFHNPQKYSWAHWPRHDGAAKLLINLICPHQNRPNHRVHALARFLLSSQHCGVTHMGSFYLLPFFPKSILPRSFRECSPYSQLVQHHHSWSTSTDTTTASSSSSLSHRMHLLCLMAWQPCLQSFVAEKPFRSLKWVLVPLRFSWGTLLPKLIGLQCVRERMLVVTGKMVISYSFKWNKS